MNGVASFPTKRGAVTWKIRYRVPIAPGARRTRQKTETLKHCSSRRQAEGVLATRVARLFDGTYRPTTSAAVTVAEEAATFLKSTKPADPENVRDGELASWRSYDSAFRLHLLPELGKLYLTDVTPARLEEFRRARRGEGAAEATIRNELRYLQSMFAFSRAEGRCTVDPVSAVSFAKIRNARSRAPTDAECLAIARYVANEPPTSFFRPVVFVLYCTALRIQSVLTLRWDRIDLDGKTAITKQKGGEFVTVALPDLLVAELRRWRPWSEGLSSSGWVFPSSRDDGHVRQTAVHKRWVKMLEACGISDLVRHDFRRRMVTALIRAGADRKGIMLTTGHTSERMIDEHYDARERSEIAPLLERVTDLKAISEESARAKPAAEHGPESVTNSDET